MDRTIASFAYLTDGTRASKTGGTTTPYLYDRAGGLARVVDDGSTGYIHGPAGLLEEVGASTTWALGDGLGSVRARTNSAGAVVGTADWDAFGNVRSSTGAGGGFGWAGEQRDSETGLTYLRSRYYSPGVGRFLTPDVLNQSGAGTQGFNRYAYAGNNPVTYADPSGYAAGLAGLGQAIAGVVWYIAAILDCYLHGECRYRRQHEGGGAAEPVPVQGRSAVASAGSPLNLAHAATRYPSLPNARTATLPHWTGLGGGGGAAIGGTGGGAWIDPLLRGIAAVLGGIAVDAAPVAERAPATEVGPAPVPTPGPSPAPTPGLGPDVALGPVATPTTDETPDDCKAALARQGWSLQPDRRQHIEDRHAPFATYPQRPLNSLFGWTAWAALDELIATALLQPSEGPFAQPNGRCLFTTRNVGFVTGIDQNQTGLTWGVTVVYNAFRTDRPGEVWTAFPV